MAKTREGLMSYSDGMPFESAWRAYAGMVEGGECTMQELHCIKPELYQMVESYFAQKEATEDQVADTAVSLATAIDWFSDCEIEVTPENMSDIRRALDLMQQASEILESWGA